MATRTPEQRIKALEEALADEEDASLEDLIHMAMGRTPPPRLGIPKGRKPTLEELILAVPEAKEGGGSV